MMRQHRNASFGTGSALKAESDKARETWQWNEREGTKGAPTAAEMGLVVAVVPAGPEHSSVGSSSKTPLV